MCIAYNVYGVQKRRVATYHVTVSGKHAHSEFIHINTVIFCTVGRPSLSRSSLQVSAYIAMHTIR